MLLNRAQMQQRADRAAVLDHLTKNSLLFLAAAHTLTSKYLVYMSQGHILKDVSIYFKGSLLLCFWGTIFILFGPTHLVLLNVMM